MSEERRHIAILFSDIVSYTRLMGADESKALDMLSKNRTIHETHIKQFNGTLIKDIGDAILGSFSLASDAVRCAIEIQKSCKNDGIPLKIGIHEGEVVFKNSDVFGDGVNIASRLQSDAQQGCINISASVYRDIKNKSDIRTSFIGEKTFKNVDEPIRVYQVLCGEDDQDYVKTETIPEKVKSRKQYFWLAGILVVSIAILLAWKYTPSTNVSNLEKSIAVLPLKYLSEDQNKQYLADGVLDAITGHLSKIDCLIVRPRTSVEQYRDTQKTTRIIGKELGVSYLVEGSFLMVNNQVKLTIQLIDARDEQHLYFDEYNRNYSNIMSVQSEVAQTIAKEIEVVISPETRRVIETNPTHDLRAYDYYLKGKDFSKRGFGEGMRNLSNSTQFYGKAQEMYQEAVEIDSNFVLAWLGLAEINRELYFFDPRYWFQPKYFQSSKEHYLKKVRPQIDKTKSYLDKAIAIAPDRMEVRREEGAYYMHCIFDYRMAIQILEKLHEDYPKDDRTIALISFMYKRMGQNETAFKYLNEAIELNPSDWTHWAEASTNLRHLRRYDEAEKYLEKAVLVNPYNQGFSERLFYMYCDRRKIKEAKQYLEEHEDILDEERLGRYRIELLWAEGNFEKSISEVKKIPNDSTISNNSFSIHQELGYKYMHLMHIQKQKEHFQKAKDIFEDLPAETYKSPDMYSKYAISLAGLGMVTQAMDTINKIQEVLEIIGRGKYIVNMLNVLWNKTILLAISNDHDALFNQIEYMLDQYGSLYIEYFKCSPSQIKCDPFWTRFEEYERFQEIINNPKYQEIPFEN